MQITLTKQLACLLIFVLVLGASHSPYWYNTEMLQRPLFVCFLSVCDLLPHELSLGRTVSDYGNLTQT